MKNPLIKKTVLVLCVLFTFGITQSLHAQGFPGGPGFQDNVDDTAPQAPINGFVGIALAVGAYFGVRKLQE